jgi:predicted Fe-Mo cluster-binding NifX family protein
MIVAVSSEGDGSSSKVDARFGRTNLFMLVETEGMVYTSVKNESSEGVGGVGPAVAQMLLDRGVKAVITGNVGPNAFRALSEGGVQIFEGSGHTVEEAVNLLMIGKLTRIGAATNPGHHLKGGVSKMKIGIPSMKGIGLDDDVGEHFGRVPYYTIVDIETNEVRVIRNTSEHMGGQGYPPDLLAREDVKVMLCQGLGRRAIAMFAEAGIEVFIGASGTIKNAIGMWKSGSLHKATEGDACQQHAFSDHHHDGGDHHGGHHEGGEHHHEGHREYGDHPHGQNHAK